MRLSFRLKGVGDAKGQGLTEFALVLPILILLIFGMVDFGRVFQAWVVTTNSAREGARLAAVECAQKGLATCQADATAKVISSAGGLDPSKLTVSYPSCSATSGNSCTVQVQYSIKLITPLIGAFFPSNPFTLKQSATMRVE